MGDWLWILGGLGLLAWLFIDALRWEPEDAMNTEDIGDLMGMYDGYDGPTNEPDFEEERFQVMYEQDGEWYEAIGESLTAEEVADALPDLIRDFGCVKVREAY